MTDTDLGPPVLAWRDDPLFNQGHIAAELALAVLRRVVVGEPYDGDAEQAVEHLEAFLDAARDEAADRAQTFDVSRLNRSEP